MTTDDEHQRDDYLWDPSAEPSADVQAVERLLAPTRFDPARRPLTLPVTRPRRRSYGRPLLAVAATVAIVVTGAAAFWSWRSTWPVDAAWPLTIEGRSSPLRPNQPLRLDPTASANIDIARIGTMRVAPGSALTVLETRSRRHRVLLNQGTVNVRTWAPPMTFAFRTPAGNVIDLGCIFNLSVAADGTSRVQVDTGWVQMENGWGESLIPAGASSVMTPTTRPGVPVYEDATPEFVAGVRAIEGSTDDSARNVDVVVRTARKRDVITLLVLARVSPASVRRPIIVRAAELVPPPSTVNVDAVAAGDRDQLWLWYDALDLPPVKSWWLNWRDALPRFR